MSVEQSWLVALPTPSVTTRMDHMNAEVRWFYIRRFHLKLPVSQSFLLYFFLCVCVCSGCDQACVGCMGGGPARCKKCARGYRLKGVKCLGEDRC